MEVSEASARCITCSVGSFNIDLLEPAGEGSVRRELNVEGEGLFQVSLAVRDLERSRVVLLQNGVVLEE